MIDQKTLKSQKSILKTHAKALGIPSGSAEIFIEKSLASAESSFKDHQIITDADLSRAIVKELKKYHSDLAYVYENYAKII